jgi:hypothetical protein
MVHNGANETTGRADGRDSARSATRAPALRHTD